MAGLPAAVTDGVNTVMSLLNIAFDAIIANPILSLFLAFSLVGLGIGAFHRLRGAVR